MIVSGTAFLSINELSRAGAPKTMPLESLRGSPWHARLGLTISQRENLEKFCEYAGITTTRTLPGINQSLMTAENAMEHSLLIQ